MVSHSAVTLPARPRYLIETLGLVAHPEGGWYRRTQTSAQQIRTGHGLRPSMTAIYYLLAEGEYSAWHRLSSQESWYFHEGDAMQIHTWRSGRLGCQKLGMDGRLCQPQAVVDADTWFASELTPSPGQPRQGYTLVSCVVSPGFDFADWCLAKPEDLSGLPSSLKRLLSPTTAHSSRRDSL